MLTPKLDLRSGDTPWDDDIWQIPDADPLPAERCEVAIVGAGITGSIVAERLSADGHHVVLLDRRSPAMGSTAASTAQIMWGMDVPMSVLAASLGEHEAARRWLRVYQAVGRFSRRLDDLKIDAGKVECPTVYLEGDLLDSAGLRAEAELHRKYGLPSSLFDANEVASRFGIGPKAAMVSDDGFTIDPVQTAHGLLKLARERGAEACFPADVLGLSPIDDGVRLNLEGGASLEADHVVLATGYERADLFLPPSFRLLSTFVIATPPGTAPMWRERAMIWEASDPYLYFRTDPEGRIIVGGSDENVIDPDLRDAFIGGKAGEISARGGSILGHDPLAIDRTWAATFGSSPDGLPAIGAAANFDRVWLAAGFGGNGIAFSALASEILSRALLGHADPDAPCFDPYRFGDNGR